MASGSGQYKSINRRRRQLAGTSPAKARRGKQKDYDESPGYKTKADRDIIKNGYSPKGSGIKVKGYSDEVPF
jgi:hypothetical protein